MSAVSGKIGHVTVTRIVEGGADAWPDTFFSGAMRDEFDRQRVWMNPDWYSGDGAPLVKVSGFVLSTGGKNLLVDTGLGDWPAAGAPPRAQGPDFLTSLRQANFEPGDIDVVAATHLHFDHIGGNTRLGAGGEVEPAFPKAQYYFCEDEWRLQSAPGREARPGLAMINLAARSLVESGRAMPVPSTFELLPGIQYIPTPGHTEGHVCVQIRSAGETGVVTGDLAHHPFQLSNPEIGSVFDENPELSYRTRQKLIAEWTLQGTTILGTHFPGRGIGRLEQQGDDSVRYIET